MVPGAHAPWGFVPFSATTVAGVGAERIHAGETGSPDNQVFAPEGCHIKILRRERLPTRLLPKADAVRVIWGRCVYGQRRDALSSLARADLLLPCTLAASCAEPQAGIECAK
jgi:hypothetical protein